MGKRNKKLDIVTNVDEMLKNPGSIPMPPIDMDELSKRSNIVAVRSHKTSIATPPALTGSSVDILPDDGLDNSGGSSEPSESLLPVSSCAFGVEISRRNLEEAKKNLKRLLDHTKTNPGLSQVKTSGGLFNWFRHNVTGDELNGLTAEIQEYLVSLNDFDANVAKGLGEVCQTIEVLDREHIHQIEISLQRAEKATQEAKDAGIAAQKALKETNKTVTGLDAMQKSLQTEQSKLHDTDEKINRNVAQLEKTILVFRSFKSDIDKIQHLKDLDKLWSDYQSLMESIDRINKRLSALEKKNRKKDGDTFEKGAKTKKQARQQETIGSVQPNQIDELNAALSETQCESNQRMSIGKKLTISFALSGASLCIALVELVLLLLR